MLAQHLSARANWEHADPQDYRYVLHRQCYCAAPNHVAVTVRAGRVVEVIDLDSAQPVKAARRNEYPTIEGLLARIDAAVARRPDTMRVSYDRWLGFPNVVDIDPSYRIADDEIRFTIDKVERLER